MEKIKLAVEKHKQLILDAERYIWANPETGYKEYKTSKYMADAFTALGYKLKPAEGITGFTAEIDTGREGPTLLILGELDSIICPTHPEADPETGAVHSCGHNAQCAALLGVAAALTEPGMLDGLCGRIRLCAVPAEELLEIGYREGLREKGVIKYFGGKTEFIHRGYFDGVDIAFMIHTSSHYGVSLGSVGCIAKKITYKGKAAHAGSAPWNGVNAIYAASLGLNAINAIRETFREQDIIRVHPIVTNGGSMVNAIPEVATLESYIRGLSYEAMVRENKKVNRALCGAALSIGANVDISDIPGYAPLTNAPAMIELTKQACDAILPHREFEVYQRYGSGSTDMGDLSCIMPVIHPYSAGGVGTSHGSDYYIEDPYAACVECAMLQVAMARMLLSNGASRAHEIIDSYTPPFASAEEYLKYVDSLNRSGDRIEYGEGEATVIL